MALRAIGGEKFEARITGILIGELSARRWSATLVRTYAGTFVLFLNWASSAGCFGATTECPQDRTGALVKGMQ